MGRRPRRAQHPRPTRRSPGQPPRRSPLDVASPRRHDPRQLDHARSRPRPPIATDHSLHHYAVGSLISDCRFQIADCRLPNMASQWAFAFLIRSSSSGYKRQHKVKHRNNSLLWDTKGQVYEKVALGYRPNEVMPKRIQDLPEEYLVNQRAVARDIGVRVRTRRTALDLTQEHLRARMELERVVVSRTQFSRIENGEALPNASEIIALHKILGVSYTWLLEGSEEGETEVS
ncbi:hypothetical protein CJ255_06910 [Candidatus Viridilinea mediisalina]|uniref:HTH cro/C1-type domain-containing protein n=2 Tax=Candidatus Viridilinea mediisalina TaxID=2024553 RepID=A0A2A6RLR2_9CHLR|nr:hypothetical protein CJ255_06910 [Candidatus Viridilinea mediisalina]